MIWTNPLEVVEWHRSDMQRRAKRFPLFAVCSFPECNPAGGGIPVRSAHAFPCYKLKYPLVHRMPSAFPERDWMKLPHVEFFKRLAALVETKERPTRGEVDQIRETEGVGEDVPLVLPCFE